MIPEPFKDRYLKLVDDPDAFLAALERPLPKSFRVNTLKASVQDVKSGMEGYGFGLRQMGWCSEAFVSDSLGIGATLEHFTGMIYIQEIASMLPPVIVKGELEDARIVLDGCAAPGSKTTQMAAIMGNKGTIIANDLDYDRIRALKFNLEKSGVINTIITNYDLQHLPDQSYDVVILDAPCSAEGTIRKHDHIFDNWSPRAVSSYSGNQRVLILKAFDLLKPGGVMVYSTCTFAPEENELVVDHLLKSREGSSLERVSVEGFKTCDGITEYEGKEFDPQVSSCVRVWPHHNDTGGFFLAKVRK